MQIYIMFQHLTPYSTSPHSSSVESSKSGTAAELKLGSRTLEALLSN
jgi:hypothetical protein